MAYEFRLPDIGEGVAEGEIVKWFVHEGDRVEEDAPLVSVLTDKANVEIPSPRAGRVAKLHAREGEKVKVGAALVTFDEGGSGGAAPRPGSAAPAPAPDRGPAPRASAGAEAEAAPSRLPGPESKGGDGGRRVLATPYVRRLAAERGIDLSGVRGTGPGGRITEPDLESRPGARAEVAPSPVAPREPPAEEPEAAAPRGPPAPASGGVPARAPAAAAETSREGAQRVPIRGLRRAIAEHMTESVHRAAHFTYVEEIDASELVRLRDRMAKTVEPRGVRLSYLPFIVKGVIAGLRAQPWMNATMDDAKQELVVHDRYHIGIATATPEGLVVPVVHDADRKSVAELARAIQELAEKGRAGKLSRAELSGGTFTITSLGALGGVLATPILNYPEVAILGVHRIVRRPVYREGADGPVPAELMNLSVSLDHRVLDGIVGAQFLHVVKEHLEDPHRLFVDLA